MEGFDEGSAPHKERPGRVFERRSSTVKHAEAEERAELARAALRRGRWAGAKAASKGAGLTSDAAPSEARFELSFEQTKAAAAAAASAAAAAAAAPSTARSVEPPPEVLADEEAKRNRKAKAGSSGEGVDQAVRV